MGKKIYHTVSDRLDPKVLIAVLVVGIIELELFSAAGDITMAAGNDAWLAVLLGGLFLNQATFLLVRLTARFPRENLFEFSRRVWGKPLSYVIAIVYLIFWAVFLTVLMKNYVEVNTTFFLHRTPAIVPLVLLAAGAVWLVCYGFPAVARFFQLMLPFLILPLLVVFALGFKNLDFDHFRPVLASGFMPVLKGALIYFGAIQGVEILLFTGPFLTDAPKTLKPAMAGVNIINLIAFLQVVVTVGQLGAKTTQELVWPSLTMLGALEWPGLQTQRFDLLLSMPLIIGLFTTACLALYLLAYGICQVFGFYNRKLVIYAAIAVPILAAYLIPNFGWTLKIRHGIKIYTIAIILLIPLITLVAAIFRGKAAEQL